jgi:hypothetical protein
MFRYSDQTWLEHDRDPLLQDMMARVMRLGLLPVRLLLSCVWLHIHDRLAGTEGRREKSMLVTNVLLLFFL